MAASITSGLCSVTTASSEVRPTWTVLEIAAPAPAAVWGRRSTRPCPFDHPPVLAAHDDDGLLDADSPLRVKLLEHCQGVVGVAVVFEGDGEPILRHELVVI